MDYTSFGSSEPLGRLCPCLAAGPHGVCQGGREGDKGREGERRGNDCRGSQSSEDRGSLASCPPDTQATPESPRPGPGPGRGALALPAMRRLQRGCCREAGWLAVPWAPGPLSWALKERPEQTLCFWFQPRSSMTPRGSRPSSTPPAAGARRAGVGAPGPAAGRRWEGPEPMSTGLGLSRKGSAQLPGRKSGKQTAGGVRGPGHVTRERGGGGRRRSLQDAAELSAPKPSRGPVGSGSGQTLEERGGGDVCAPAFVPALVQEQMVEATEAPVRDLKEMCSIAQGRAARP